MVHSHDFYNQYQQAYIKYTEQYGKLVCVFLKKGSFYEFYGQEDSKTQQQLNSAKDVMELFGIAIHVYPGEGPHGTTGYFGGVPEYTLDKWAGKLTKLGWTVVVIDEIKTAANKVSKREVTRILSAGTHIEVAESASAFFLTSMWLDTVSLDKPPRFGLVSADLTTGQVYLYEGQATGSANQWHTDDVRHCFQVYPPRELLLLVRGLPLAYDEDTLRRTFHLPSTVPIHLRIATKEVQGALEQPQARETYLRQLFQPKTALPLRTWLRVSPDGASLTERALCSLLRFAEDHAPKLAECLQAPKLWHPKDTLQVINNALIQLNLVKLGTASDQQCIEDLFVKPLTAMGKRSLTARLCSPLTDATQIQKRQEQLHWILTASDLTRTQLQTGLSLLFDLSRLHRFLYRGSITALDVVHYHQTLSTLQFLLPQLRTSPFFQEHLVQDITICLEQFSQQFDLEKAKKAAEQPEDLGCLLDSTGPKTASVEQQIRSIHSKADQWLRDLRSHTGVDPDAMYFKSMEKTVFTLHCTKSAAKLVEQALTSLPSQFSKLHIKHLSSNARIEHKDLDTFEASLDAARKSLQRTLAVELPVACVAYSQTTRELWQPIEDWIIDIDLSHCMAKTSHAQGWVKPTIEADDSSNPSSLSIKNLRHPLIEAQKRQSKLVTHDIDLGHNGGATSSEHGQGWLLYGMNASGKSSLMKAIGVAVCLAQIGCYVPATEMRLRPFHKLATRILNQDNLWAGLSSFAVEMSELRDMFQLADHQTLVLGDELCSGTESISATAIVAAGIQWLHKAGARFVLATHLHDLTRLSAITSLPALRFWHLHVEYDRLTDKLIYHRTLSPGSGSTLYGLEVARALHLPTELLDAAFQHRRELTGDTGIEKAKSTTWTADLVRFKCDWCEATDGLEVHHIQERHEAEGSRNQDGTPLNHPSNLVVLCASCHDKHHNQSISVQSVQDTSDGPQRPVNLQQYAYVPPSSSRPQKKTLLSTFSSEQQQSIRSLLQNNKLDPFQLLKLKLETDVGIRLTEAKFKTLLKEYS